MNVIHKIHIKADKGMEFILSDATPDRYGDIILADGWQLENFNKNPIALFGHQSSFPIGTWENVSIKDGALRGFLKMAPEGTSERIDEIGKLIEAGVLKAVSVGFRPIESKPISSDSYGEIYMKQELVETSVVSVPANPNALAVAKSLGISDDTMKVAFAKQGNEVTITERSIDTTKTKMRRTKSSVIVEPPLVHVIKWRDQEIVTPVRTTLWQGKRVPA